MTRVALILPVYYTKVDSSDVNIRSKSKVIKISDREIVLISTSKLDTEDNT